MWPPSTGARSDASPPTAAIRGRKLRACLSGTLVGECLATKGRLPRDGSRVRHPGPLRSTPKEIWLIVLSTCVMTPRRVASEPAQHRWRFMRRRRRTRFGRSRRQDGGLVGQAQSVVQLLQSGDSVDDVVVGLGVDREPPPGTLSRSPSTGTTAGPGRASARASRQPVGAGRRRNFRAAVRGAQRDSADPSHRLHGNAAPRHRSTPYVVEGALVVGAVGRHDLADDVGRPARFLNSSIAPTWVVPAGVSRSNQLRSSGAPHCPRSQPRFSAPSRERG